MNPHPTMVVSEKFLTRDASGAFVFEASVLGKYLGWSPETVHYMMNRGLISGRLEDGIGEDQGKQRLSISSGNRRWQAVILSDGTILEQHVDFIKPRRLETTNADGHHRGPCHVAATGKDGP